MKSTEPFERSPARARGAFFDDWRRATDRSRRASMNALASGLDYGARVAVEFVLTPLMVAGLGAYLYGAWRVLWRLSGYLWASSGRSSQALQIAVSRDQHSTDHGGKRELVGGALVVWLIFLPLLGVLGAVAVWIAPFLLKAPPAYVTEIRIAAALLVVDSLALTILSVPRSVLLGENLGYKRMGLSMSLVLLQGGLTWLALALDTGLVGVAVANAVGTLTSGVVFVIVTKRHVPWFGLRRPSRSTVRFFLGLSWWFIIWKLLMQLMVGGDIVVLGFFASVQLVTVYTLTKFIPDAVLALFATLVMSAAPGIGGLLGTGRNERAAKARRELMAMTWLAALVAGVTVTVWNRSFIGLWVGSRFYPGRIATLMIMVAALQLILIRNDAFLIDLTLNMKPKVLLGGISTVLSLVLAAVFAGPLDLGIVGLCAGLILGRSILSIAYPWLIGRAIGQPLQTQLRGAIRPAVATASAFGVAYAASGWVDTESWPTLALGALATVLVVSAFTIVVGFDAEQRGALSSRLRRMLGLVEAAA